ncbi:MAG: FGGY-family carbohydrate kinase [Pygmaiobacter massiliensis]|nr:FGGY-family carbohydrate kinase [Pygmaiobacter massiliensis]
MKYLMGIDIGTNESKGVIVDQTGQIVASAATPHGMENPKPNYYEHDAEQVWWKDFCILSHTLLEKSKLAADQIAAVGVSTLGTCCLPVDENCRPLRKAILYGIDARSQKEIQYLTEYYGEKRVQELFGRPLCSGDVCAKILWIRNNEPEVYEKTYKFLPGSSYLVAKLTGEYVVDRFLGLASLRPMYNPDGSIRAEECSLFCRPDQLPEGRVSCDVAGYVTEQAAAETGLAVGTPVTVGTGDSTAESISTGVLHPGDMMVQFGSSIFIYCCTDHLVYDDRVRGNNFTVPGTFSVAAGTNNCGTVTKWFRDNLFPEALEQQKAGGANAFQTMMEGLDEIAPGSDGLVMLPYMTSGERTPINDPNAKGVIFGLTDRHTKRHLYRAALESVAYAVGQHVDILKENNIPLSRIMAVGGGTQNPLWMQIVADVIGEPLQLAAVTIGASYGDALMAGIGAGLYRDFEALGQIIKPARTFTPDPERHEQYKKYRKLYDDLYLATRDLMHTL